MEIIKFMTFFIGVIILFIDIRKFMNTKKINVYFCIESVIFFFYYIPLFCDLIFGRPKYKPLHRGFIESYDDFSTEIIYCLIILYIIFMFHFFQRKNTVEINLKFENTKYSNLFSYIIFISIVCLLLYICVLIDEDMWKEIFSYNMRNIISPEAIVLKRIAFVLILLSLLFVIVRDSNLVIKIIFMIPNLIFACFLNGKRASVFFSVIGLLAVIIMKKMIKSKGKLIFIIFISMLMLGIYVNFYAENITSTEDEYMSYRVNFGRDDTLKMTIYSETKGNKILEYRGQTLVFYLTFFIRRANWKAKPYPFATYFTASLLKLNSVRDLGWNMTTSIFDEALANFSWFGIIITPFIFNIFIKIFTKKNKGILGKSILFLGLLNMVLLLAVQASAFLVLYILHIVLIILYDLKQFFYKGEKKKISEN